MVHHPPQDGATRRLRAFADRARLHDVLARAPVDLVLHGHLHYPTRASLSGPSGPIPVLGAASGSAAGGRKAAAHYHLIDIDDNGGGTPAITVRHAHYRSSTGGFQLTEPEGL